MELLKLVNLALAFAVELCALAAFGYWGFQTGQGQIARIGLAVGAPLLAAVLWGIFEAPNASLPFPEPWHLLFALAFFGWAAALYATGHARLGLIFAPIVVVNQILIYVWRQ